MVDPVRDSRYRLVVLSWLIAAYYVQYRTKSSTEPSTEQDLATVLRPVQDKYSTGPSTAQDLATVLRPVQDLVQNYGQCQWS